MAATPSFTRRRLLALGPASLLGLASACQEKEFACDSVVGLTPQGMAVRGSVAYVDRSKVPEQNCANCQQYVPAPESGQCGSCKVMPGLAHPKGHCKVWAQRST